MRRPVQSGTIFNPPENFEESLNRILFDMQVAFVTGECQLEKTLFAFDIDNTVMGNGFESQSGILYRVRQAIFQSDQVIQRIQRLGVSTIALTARPSIRNSELTLISQMIHELELESSRSVNFSESPLSSLSSSPTSTTDTSFDLKRDRRQKENQIRSKLESQAWHTLRELNQVGITLDAGIQAFEGKKLFSTYKEEGAEYGFFNLERESPVRLDSAGPLPDLPYYREGVLMASALSKGAVLRRFLELQRATFECIFFVDDLQTNHDSMIDSFKFDLNRKVYLYLMPLRQVLAVEPTEAFL